MKSVIYFLAALLAVVGCGCSKQRYFKVKGEIEGLGSQTVTMLYYAAGGLQRTTAHGDGTGAFELQGESAVPTLAVVELADGTVLANLVAQNGNNITLEGETGNPMDIKVKGSGPSSAIAKWQNENAAILASGNAAAINQAVKRFVENNKGNIASTAILVTHFRADGYETMADSLMTIINPDVRPGSVVQNFSSVLATQLSSKTLATVKPMLLFSATDTTFYFVPSAQKISLLAFVPELRNCRDSIVPQLAALKLKYGDRRFDVVEFASGLDSLQWRNSIKPDSASWHQVWAPGSVSAPAVRSLTVPRVPYFIVVDSAGNQLLRTHSISAANDAVRKALK